MVDRISLKGSYDRIDRWGKATKSAGDPLLVAYPGLEKAAKEGTVRVHFTKSNEPFGPALLRPASLWRGRRRL